MSRTIGYISPSFFAFVAAYIEGLLTFLFCGQKKQKFPKKVDEQAHLVVPVCLSNVSAAH